MAQSDDSELAVLSLTNWGEMSREGTTIVGKVPKREPPRLERRPVCQQLPVIVEQPRTVCPRDHMTYRETGND